MKQLQHFGLSHYESKALGVLLREQCTVRTLSRKAGIPPGKVYSVLHSLRQRGFTAETDGRPKMAYVPDADAVITKLIAEKQRQDESLYAHLRLVAAEVAVTHGQQTPFFQMGTTIEENKAIQLRTFTEANHEVCQIMNVHHKPASNRGSKSIWEREIQKAVSRGVLFRAVYPSSVVLPYILQQLPSGRFCVRRLDTDFIRCDIIDKKKVLLKLVHHDQIAFGGVIFLENERFARNLQAVFEQLWEQAKK
ncbi:hypothetical protein HY639_02325 [Candidatus Woesearchaeota archaeon]|nr:hypothetical protein [Candidatus Woesearchaeota archaeon]